MPEGVALANVAAGSGGFVVLRSAALARKVLITESSPLDTQRCIHILTDDAIAGSALESLLAPWFRVGTSSIQDGAPARHDDADSVILSVDLRSFQTISALKAMDRDLRRFKNRLFIVDARVRLISARAYAMGATKVVRTPITAEKLMAALIDQDQTLTASREAAAQGAIALAQMFSAAQSGRSLDTAAARAAAAVIANTIENDGLTNWVRAVRSHHEGTYQHCLLVTGVAVDFGASLGVSRADLERLCLAAMFHDIGKATIPPEILDKPGKLDEDERRIIETHPGAGYDILKSQDGMTAEILGAVRHHHEFLDGTGYPDRLSGQEIPDLVRVLTISDIFAALIENRSYRPPMPRDKAYEIIRSMKGKLEGPLITAFSRTALSR